MSTKLVNFISICSVSFSSSIFSAQPVLLGDESPKNLQKDFQWFQPSIKQLTATNVNTIQVMKERVDENQVKHIRIQQKYHGFPVFGGHGVIHSEQAVKGFAAVLSQDTTKMNGTLFKGLENELGKPSLEFQANAQKALEQFKTRYKEQNISEEEVIPLVYIDQDHKAYWAYQVSILVHYKDKIPARPTAILRADNFTPFIEWNEIKTLSKAYGLGFGGNHKTSKYEFGNGKPLLHITRDRELEVCFMENEGVRVVDLNHSYGSFSNAPMKFNCPNPDPVRRNAYWTGYHGDGYDMENGAFSPINDAMYAGQVINNMYQRWFGLNALTQDNEPMQIIMRVHYGEGYENAFWDGKQMTFGDGRSMMYPLVSLGVGAHEISHGFTEQHSGLRYYGQSGGMNESFSDMAAQAAEYYSLRKSSWEIGGEIMKTESGIHALRYMDLPSQDGRSIDKAYQYRDGLDVHYSSGVYNRLFYLIANTRGWNPHKAFHVMVKANMDYWTPSTNFEEGGCGVINAAYDLGYSPDDIKQSLDEVAISYQNCSIVSFKVA
ncbi:zinc metalloprotease ProA [Legionella impletisoli]|uniref:Neutral metalloproteinase n=1 Tax=Legionella impletisoli TaxID=343510 RepID=A0A917JV25_9GAMM|nr:M4 family metallopeptidase [Legionella impletisoli]GGI86419.1 zinc metalloprotease [Legionella impletisoli]